MVYWQCQFWLGSNGCPANPYDTQKLLGVSAQVYTSQELTSFCWRLLKSKVNVRYQSELVPFLAAEQYSKEGHVSRQESVVL